LAPEDQPTKLRLAKLPLDFLQRRSRCFGAKFVFPNANVSANSIHRLRHIVSVVTRQVLLQRIADELTTGTLGPLSHSFSTLKYFVWNRDRRFHTKSITRTKIAVNPQHEQKRHDTLIERAMDWRFFNELRKGLKP
jgi:hypothetical protein